MENKVVLTRGSSPRRNRSAAAFMLALLGLISAPAIATAQLPDAFSSARPERYEDSVTGELIKGKSVELEAELVIIFKTGPETYVTLRPEAAQVLGSDPVIDCPPGLTARIVAIDAKLSKVLVGIGIGEGFTIRCKLQIATDGEITPGDYEVIVALPAISEIAAAAKATSPREAPTARYKVKVYESQQAFDAAKEAERKARLEAEAAALQKRQAEEAEALRKRQA